MVAAPPPLLARLFTLASLLTAVVLLAITLAVGNYKLFVIIACIVHLHLEHIL